MDLRPKLDKIYHNGELIMNTTIAICRFSRYRSRTNSMITAKVSRRGKRIKM